MYPVAALGSQLETARVVQQILDSLGGPFDAVLDQEIVKHCLGLHEGITIAYEEKKSMREGAPRRRINRNLPMQLRGPAPKGRYV